jgi:hypothetical protein
MYITPAEVPQACQEDTGFMGIRRGILRAPSKQVDLEKILSHMYLGQTFLKIYI